MLRLRKLSTVHDFPANGTITEYYCLLTSNFLFKLEILASSIIHAFMFVLNQDHLIVCFFSVLEYLWV